MHFSPINQGKVQVTNYFLKLRKVWFYLTDCLRACFGNEWNIKGNDTIYQFLRGG